LPTEAGEIHFSQRLVFRAGVADRTSSNQSCRIGESVRLTTTAPAETTTSRPATATARPPANRNARFRRDEAVVHPYE
jgi:hypothetical protein